MLRKSDLLWLSLAAFAGVTLFHTSYRVQSLREEISTLDRQIISEQDGIRVTKAEWGILNDPVRLEQLAGTYLTLTPITASQVAGFDALPVRPPGQPGPSSNPSLVASAQNHPSSTPTAVHSVAGASATLASVTTPHHKTTRPSHPGAGQSLSLTHVSARAAPVYKAGQDDIGKLLNQLGHIQ